MPKLIIRKTTRWHLVLHNHFITLSLQPILSGFPFHHSDETKNNDLHCLPDLSGAFAVANSLTENIFFIWLPGVVCLLHFLFWTLRLCSLSMMPKTTLSPGLPYLHRCPFRGSLALSSMALYMLMFHKPIFSTPHFSHYLSIPTRKYPPDLFTYLSEAYLKLKLNSQILANHIFCLVFPISENTSENC